MNKLLFIISLLLMTPFSSFTQESINDYKYVIIPNQYSFLSEADQYQLNSLTKFLFNKYGYTAFMQDEDFPEDLQYNKCLALYADVNKGNAFLKIKIEIALKDCEGKVVIVSKEGGSREKEYSKAYNLALREAFETFQNINYVYKPNDNILSKGLLTSDNTTKEKAEIKRLKEEIEDLKEQKNTITEEVIVVPEKKEDSKVKEVTNLSEVVNTLYAQATNNGFQVVDSTPKVVMILLQTSKENTFIVKGENAIVYEEDGFWYISKNDGVKVSVERLDIKF